MRFFKVFLWKKVAVPPHGIDLVLYYNKVMGGLFPCVNAGVRMLKI